MYETVKVRAVEYAPGHKHYPDHSSKPRGPLVRLPGSEAPAQLYIGHKRVRIQPTLVDHPTKAGVKIEKVIPDPMSNGEPRMGTEIVEGDNRKPKMMQKPVVYRWEYDPTPIEVELNPGNDYIRKAISRGDLEVVEDKPAKAKKGGE